ncbi:Uncharacterized protein OBRU01_02152, partial [Operophtera brumata]
ETNGELIFADSNKFIETPEENEVDYWAHRIDNLKKEHHIINKIIGIEYDKQIEKTNEVFEPPPVITHERIQKIKPCFDWRTKPLVCSNAVQAFTKCVASCRVDK